MEEMGPQGEERARTLDERVLAMERCMYGLIQENSKLSRTLTVFFDAFLNAIIGAGKEVGLLSDVEPAAPEVAPEASEASPLESLVK